MADAVWQHVALVAAVGVAPHVVLDSTETETSGSSQSRLPRQVQGLQALLAMLQPHWTRGILCECLPGRLEGVLHLLTIRRMDRTREGSLQRG